MKSSFGSTTDKKNFLDEAIRVGRQTPGPTSYKPKGKWRIVGGMDGKGYRGSFLDECEVAGNEKPGVGRYKPNYDSQRKHISTPIYKMKRKSVASSSYGDQPDPGTYNSAQSFKKVCKSFGTATISKSKIKSFNEQAAFSKKFVPGSGYYDIEK